MEKVCNWSWLYWLPTAAIIANEGVKVIDRH